ncbi:hypothetical protein PIB30_063954 [Stylosanthes scabra]|uniref:Uncharacterized protein n=1 Tax=Stylosanthes scabra TaxID=79078 RepID=A0ABU6UKE7_9FABA|nr:hypothetical protein [Stylosanthes scabra]
MSSAVMERLNGILLDEVIRWVDKVWYSIVFVVFFVIVVWGLGTKDVTVMKMMKMMNDGGGGGLGVERCNNEESVTSEQAIEETLKCYADADLIRTALQKQIHRPPPRSQSPSIWSPPPPGRYKLNVDVAVINVGRNAAGMGLLLAFFSIVLGTRPNRGDILITTSPLRHCHQGLEAINTTNTIKAPCYNIKFSLISEHALCSHILYALNSSFRANSTSTVSKSIARSVASDKVVVYGNAWRQRRGWTARVETGWKTTLLEGKLLEARTLGKLRRDLTVDRERQWWRTGGGGLKDTRRDSDGTKTMPRDLSNSESRREMQMQNEKSRAEEEAEVAVHKQKVRGARCEVGGACPRTN